MRKKEVVAMLLAGGQGKRLKGLTRTLAKPAVFFGGTYRIIDFPLSNCTHSGIDTVGVLTQYEPLVLHSYIGVGSDWDLDRLDGGVLFYHRTRKKMETTGTEARRMQFIETCISWISMTQSMYSFCQGITFIKWTTVECSTITRRRKQTAPFLSSMSRFRKPNDLGY